MPRLLKHAIIAVLACCFDLQSAAPALAKAVFWRSCPPFEKRITCVVDGDTLWYQGRKIRLLAIDAPEIKGRCPNERAQAEAATRHLIVLLSTGLVRIECHGRDRYGRYLARIWTRSGEVGPTMIGAGLAVPFGLPRRTDWCRR